MKREALLPYYAEHFNLVEVNSSFYGVPRKTSVEKWVQQTPDDFTFDIKLPQLLSYHQMDFRALPDSVKAVAQPNERGKAIRTPEAEKAMMKELSETLSPLQDAGKMGVTLLQLSPSFSPRANKLSDLDFILDNAPFDVAVEFRNQGWLMDEQVEKTIDYLAGHKAVFVNLDAPTGPHFTMMPKVSAVTKTGTAYLRCHGRNAQAYLTGKTVADRFNYDYTNDEINEIAQRTKHLAAHADKIHIVFNNNRSNYAPKAAMRLSQVLRRAGV